MSDKLNFNIDLAEVLSEVQISEKEANAMAKYVLQEVTQAILSNWQQAARTELNSTRQGYLKGLRIVEEGKLTNSIVLVGSFNNMVEMGCSSFDQKQGFSRSSKVKMGKNGWYLRIPFRMAAPDSLGESEVFSGNLPSEVHKVAKNLKANTELGKSKKVSRGLKAIEIPSPHDIPKSRAVILEQEASNKFNIIQSYQHKGSIYEGLFKSTQAGHSSYTSIRTVGAKSDANAFIHKGIKAYNFAEKALNNGNLGTIVENSIDNFLSSL